MESAVDRWWASRPITEKERIASKICGKEIHYPECTEVWNNLLCEQQVEIYEHCSSKHGQVQRAWHRGSPIT